MEKTRHQMGLDKILELDKDGEKRLLDPLIGVAPELRGFILNSFADYFYRDVLSMQEKEMMTTVVLLTLGNCEPQLELHINISLNAGNPPEKIIESFIQCLPYAGFPRVLNAVRVVKKVFDERGIVVVDKTTMA